jgi:hypothetical protein
MASRRTPVPADLAEYCRKLLATVNRRGGDHVEALNEKDLLLTPLKQKAIELDVLRRFSDELMRWQPHEMLRRELPGNGPGTPADMYRAVQGFLDDFIKERKERQW